MKIPRETYPYIGLALCLTVAFIAVFLRQAGVMPTAIVGGSMLGGTVCWLATTARCPARPERVLPIYAVTVALLMAHILEEYITGFGPRIAALTGSGWTEGEFIATIGFVVPLFWIFAAALIHWRNPIGNWIMWFVWFGMVLGEPVHLLVFPLKEGGRYHYFPGMWTALLPLVVGLWGMSVLVSDYREAKREAQA